MDILFCDELLQEIFRRLPPSSAAAVALVSRRWRRLLRSSTTSLSLNFPPPYNPTTITSFSSFLYHHPFLSSLSASAAADGGAGDHPLLLSVAASCPNLRHLRLFGPPVSSLSLSNLSKSFLHLSSLSVAVLRPFSLNWLPCFSSLTRLSLSVKNPLPEIDDSELGSVKDSIFDVELRLESLSLSGISQRDYGVAYLWRNCKNVTKLELNCCEGLGDFSSFSDFLRGLMSLKLQSCCFVTGEGLRAVGRALNGALEELSLINCDVVVKERGLLTTLGQDFNGLKRLDLSYNGMLVDKEVVSMLASCDGLVELRLRGCSRLSDAVADAMVRRCKRLQVVDVACCCGIRVQGVEIILLNSLGLRRVEVERNKLSEAAMARVADRFVEVVC
ncbi:F-box/LRR-repeat protein 3-like isoform X2 [Salvia hispanica]|uniref:F-box/LRR-repeat protein 3-like isoform X2 n=1 Tax=Salvia hispanica TaxID=49212 RepID=UPI0020093554|nr:F-box/LRR-repeat protein 3-like isoform X2 [Salvia hispanica]